MGDEGDFWKSERKEGELSKQNLVCYVYIS